jgi:phytoene desaturase
VRVVVVGAGLGGLSAACQLVGRGHEVTVLERGPSPGGRAGRWESGGYAFDTGPVVLTMVDLLAEAFEAAGTTIEAHLQLERLDPAYRACFADGSELRVRAGRQEMAAEIEAVCGRREADAYEGFCDWLTELARVELPHFIGRNYDSPLDLAATPGALLQLLRLGGFGRLDARVRRTFHDERLRRLFSFQALYAGLSPFQALALFAVITYMDTVAGVWWAPGGLHAVAGALADAAASGGATVRCGAPVAAIVRDASGWVRGVRLDDGELVGADIVVANPDLPAVYRELLGRQPPRSARTGTYSPSALVWLAGVDGALPEGAAHHNIHFGHDWEAAFDDLLGRGRQMRDPSLLISVPSLTQPDLAPPGRHGLYVLEPVPNLDALDDWATRRGPARDALAARVAAAGYPDVVEVEQLTTPDDWAAQGLERGTPFSLAHRFTQSGPFRTANVDRHVPGLVLVGSGTQPGVGVPMVLLSGRLAAERVDQIAGGQGRGGAGRRRWGAGR